MNGILTLVVCTAVTRGLHEQFRKEADALAAAGLHPAAAAVRFWSDAVFAPIETAHNSIISAIHTATNS